MLKTKTKLAVYYPFAPPDWLTLLHPGKHLGFSALWLPLAFVQWKHWQKTGV